ncbi:MAG: tetratricopeptide repeat protein [Pseudomonadota bacterium]|nr:tetratricopeptide repeat protein [Pseudomonadota bacterium]
MRYLAIVASLVILGCTSSQVITQANSEKLVNDVEFSTLPAANTGKCPDRIVEDTLKFWKSAVILANNCVVAKNWNQVESVGHKMSENFPHSPWGFYYLSVVAEHQNDSSRALWLLEKAQELDKSIALIPYQKGRVLLRIADHENARKEFARALSLDDKLPDAYLYLGQFALRDQNYKLADKYFQGTLKYQAFNREALFGSAQCKVQMGDAKMALDYAERIISSNKKDVEVRLFKAFVLESYLQNLDEALAEYRHIYAMSLSQRKVIIGDEELSNKIKSIEVLLKNKKQNVARHVSGVKK